MEAVHWVLVASLMVWAGIFYFLLATESRVRRLEKRLSERDQA